MKFILYNGPLSEAEGTTSTIQCYKCYNFIESEIEINMYLQGKAKENNSYDAIVIGSGITGG